MIIKRKKNARPQSHVDALISFFIISFIISFYYLILLYYLLKFPFLAYYYQRSLLSTCAKRAKGLFLVFSTASSHSTKGKKHFPKPHSLCSRQTQTKLGHCIVLRAPNASFIHRFPKSAGKRENVRKRVRSGIVTRLVECWTER